MITGTAFLATYVLTLISPVASQSNYATYLSRTQSDVSQLISKVRDWDASKGLTAALDIQNSYEPFQQSVNGLRGSLNSLSAKDIDTTPLVTLVDSIVQLLQSLNGKVDAFNELGLKSISSRDISNLEQPAIDIVNGLTQIIRTDCQKMNQLRGPVQQLGSAFSASDRAYGLNTPQFPTVPQCSPAHFDDNDPADSEELLPVGGHKSVGPTMYSTAVDYEIPLSKTTQSEPSLPTAEPTAEPTSSWLGSVPGIVSSTAIPKATDGRPSTVSESRHSKSRHSKSSHSSECRHSTETGPFPQKFNHTHIHGNHTRHADNGEIGLAAPDFMKLNIQRPTLANSAARYTANLLFVGLLLLL